jgi:hypothetical protein
MDKLCYGLTMQVPDGHGGFTELDSGACGDLVVAFKHALANNWRPDDGTRIKRGVGIETKKNPNDPNDNSEPCIDSNKAYMTSKTVPSGVAGGACEQQKWLDSLVPFIVVPKCWTKAYRTYSEANKQICAQYLTSGNEPDLAAGDLVALLSRKAGDKPIYALIGDAGPNYKLGEASIGLLMKSEGKSVPPTYVAASDWYDRRKKFDVVIFRGTKYGKPITIGNYGDIEKSALDKLKVWVGGDEAAGLARLAACGAKASPGPK